MTACESKPDLLRAYKAGAAEDQNVKQLAGRFDDRAGAGCGRAQDGGACPDEFSACRNFSFPLRFIDRTLDSAVSIEIRTNDY